MISPIGEISAHYALEFELTNCGHCERHPPLPTLSCGLPVAHSSAVLRDGIKSIVLLDGCMPARELQVMLGSFTGLKVLEISNFQLHLESESSDFTEKRFSLSLERHAATLRKLSVSWSSIRFGPFKDRGVNEVDFAGLSFRTSPRSGICSFLVSRHVPTCFLSCQNKYLCIWMLCVCATLI